METDKELNESQLNNEEAETADDAMGTALREIMADDIQKERQNTSEEIAKNLILEKMPANKITQVTKVDKTRLTQIAKSIGTTPVLN